MGLCRDKVNDTTPFNLLLIRTFLFEELDGAVDELGEVGSFEEAVAEEGEVYDLLDYRLGPGVVGYG